MNRQFGERRRSAWLGAVNAAFRRASRGGVYGRIVSRANVGFADDDWRYLCWSARVMECTISDEIRSAVAAARARTNEAITGDGGSPDPWLVDDFTLDPAATAYAQEDAP